MVRTTMTEAVLEIVELDTGEVVLRRTDSSAGSSEPFVTIKFSQEAKELVNGQTGHLARFMISVGLQMVAKMNADSLREDTADEEHSGDTDLDDEAAPPNTRLH